MSSMFSRITTILVIVLFLSSSLLADDPCVDDPIYYVSLVQLITEPSRFVGHRVSATGFLRDDGSAIFLTEDHANFDDVASSVFVSISYGPKDISETGIAKTGCESNFVRVSGRFEENTPGEFMITQIQRILEFDPNAELEKNPLCWANPDGQSD